MESLRQLPAPDQIEVSLFGPGVGECVVVHLGEGDWVVVDSCIDTRSRNPIALEYLDGLGVDISKAVKLLVVTHWHDDHIRGSSRILKATGLGRLACSAALRSNEFLQLVAMGERAMMESPGVAEFAEILETLRERAPAGAKPEAVGPVWTMANHTLLRLEGAGRKWPAEVQALSPSPGSINLALAEIARLLPRHGQPKRRAVAQSPNQVSVVLWAEVGDVRVLLGSDLVTGADPTTGWRAIIASPVRPAERAQTFKVPHHGSPNADDPAVWVQILSPTPYALLTPFSSGSNPLPSPNDLARLRGRTRHVYCTARPDGWAPRNRGGAVERTLREVARKRRAIIGPMGHIRVRSRIGSAANISVELFGGAFRAA